MSSNLEVAERKAHSTAQIIKVRVRQWDSTSDKSNEQCVWFSDGWFENMHQSMFESIHYFEDTISRSEAKELEFPFQYGGGARALGKKYEHLQTKLRFEEFETACEQASKIVDKAKEAAKEMAELKRAAQESNYGGLGCQVRNVLVLCESYDLAYTKAKELGETYGLAWYQLPDNVDLLDAEHQYGKSSENAIYFNTGKSRRTNESFFNEIHIYGLDGREKSVYTIPWKEEIAGEKVADVMYSSRFTKEPSYSSDGAAGLDLCIPESFTERILGNGEHVVIDSNLSFIVPVGHCLFLTERSSLGRLGLYVKCPVIDSDFRGEFKFVLQNFGLPIKLSPGMKICQGLLLPVTKARLVKCQQEIIQQSETTRGTSGFGKMGGK